MYKFCFNISLSQVPSAYTLAQEPINFNQDLGTDYKGFLVSPQVGETGYYEFLVGFYGLPYDDTRGDVFITSYNGEVTMLDVWLVESATKHELWLEDDLGKMDGYYFTTFDEHVTVSKRSITVNTDFVTPQERINYVENHIEFHIGEQYLCLPTH